MSNKIAEMLTTGKLTPTDLVGADALIKRANLVDKAVKACEQFAIPLGVEKLQCYAWEDPQGEYSVYGYCTHQGEFTCHSTLGGSHEIGKCNLLDFGSIFGAFENQEFADHLERFCNQRTNNR